jgi:hypothetical protein
MENGSGCKRVGVPHGRKATVILNVENDHAGLPIRASFRMREFLRRVE